MRNENKNSNDSITKTDLKRMGCRRYGFISKARRRVGQGLIVIALLPLMSLWLLPIALMMLGTTPYLMYKRAKIQIKERLRLI